MSNELITTYLRYYNVYKREYLKRLWNKRAVLNRPIHIKVILTKTIKTLDKIKDLCYNKAQLKANWIFRDSITSSTDAFEAFSLGA